MKNAIIAFITAILLLCLSTTAFAAYVGDVNNDGKITASDARIILRHSAKIEPIADNMLSRADVDGNGKVNAADARIALRMGAKLEDLKEDHTHDYKTTEIQKLDCEKDGIIEYRCSVCDHSYQDITKTTGHNYTYEITKDASCGVEGAKKYTCANCKHTYTEAIEALEHSYTASITLEATCNIEGIKEYTCTNCKHTYTESIDALKHSYTSTITLESSCNVEGIKEYKCTNCNHTYAESIETIPHTYTEKTVKEPNCGNGIKEFRCSVCSYAYTEEIPATVLNHRFTKVEITKYATCGETGIRKYTCEICGAIQEDEISKTAVHTYDKTIKITKEPTYDNAGESIVECSVCGDTITKTIPSFSWSHPVYIHMPTTPIIVDDYADLFRIDDITFDTEYLSYNKKYRVNLYFTGEKTFGRANDGIRIEYKIYDAEGYVVYSGYHYTDNLSPGEKIKNSDTFATSLERGEYTLKITNVLVYSPK